MSNLFGSPFTNGGNSYFSIQFLVNVLIFKIFRFFVFVWLLSTRSHSLSLSDDPKHQRLSPCFDRRYFVTSSFVSLFIEKKEGGRLKKTVSEGK